jgi:hypothetical protein
MKYRTLLALCGLAVLIGSAVLFGVAAISSRADPNLPNVFPHRHWINGVQVGPDLCDNLGNPGIQQAFNEFHNNLHVATAASIGPAAPGLHNGITPDIKSTSCAVTTPPTP